MNAAADKTKQPEKQAKPSDKQAKTSDKQPAKPVDKQQDRQRLMTVLLAPQISEKSTFVGEKNNQYVFRVAADATKPEIKAAVELLFSTKDKKVQVATVQVLNVKGKEKRFGRYEGRRRNWKKAYVRLAQGQEISFQATE
jgi:large subunit ribosomal protein L23